MHQTEIVVLLLMAAAALVVVAQKIELPYPVGLVVAGLALSFIPHLPVVQLNPEVVLYVFLPALLYPAALFTSWRDFRRNLRGILWLAIGLVLATMATVAAVTHELIPALPWAAAFALGAIVSPPDAIAATAVIRRLSVPYRIEALLEGESLVNDATALVALQFALGALTSGQFSIADASVRFVFVSAGGIALGLAVGYVMRWVQRRLDDPPVQIIVSLLTPFVCYLAAEAVDTSGVLAVVVCGLYYGWRAPTIVSSRLRLRAYPVWEMVQFILNGAIFMLIGLQLPDVLTALAGRSWREVTWFALVILVPVILLRIAWLFAMAYAPRLVGRRRASPHPGAPAWRQLVLIGWTGMRGVDSLAAALAVPLVVDSGAPFPDRDLIFFLTFAVIFGTLVLQGLSLAPVIRWLGVEDDRAWEKEERKARLRANEAALARVQEIAAAENVDREVRDRLVSEYEERIEQLKGETADGNAAGQGLFSADFEKLSQAALEAERRTILDLRNRLVINDEALRRIQRDIDLAEIRLQHDRSGGD